ncbi:hypothetical protein ABL78_7955 [Leptomonas seymouri]|uniref:Uncharacterized protein n=1 Tax=Leptomonas seymouri TaxID=5684 RepID=A0A0N0P2Y2_LEPSE|nr:hypothetical protein ABL78_7955 [Leptomonas seymouri]|eukprot:KPI83027.1 hypothetical protein ABL78_7955 [Leptomonas seymouri]
MGARLRCGWGRRLHLWLTTSARDRQNRIDDVGGNLQAARRERNRIQRVNDLFHSAGMGASHADSLEGITMQGRGESVAWSFLLIPTVFAVGVLTIISLCCRGERRAQQQAAESAWQHQLSLSADRKAAADAALRAAQDQGGELKAAARSQAEDNALGAKLESNLEVIMEHLKRRPPPDASDNAQR